MADELGDRAVALLTDLLRIDTTNPPGRERPAAELLAGVLADIGIEPQVLESAPGRANVVARVKGNGSKPPLMLTAHLDVVPADPLRWQHPPFGGETHDGYLWGRGAVDMKNMAAMSVAVLERLVREKVPLDRDVIFAGVADEESGCEYGSRFLVDHHADLVRAECTLGEVGAFSLHLFGRVFYPIQVAEKGLVWIKARFTGEPGHGSMPIADSAVAELARAVARLADSPLPIHPCDPTTQFLQALGEHLPRPLALLLPRLADPRLGAMLLKHAVRDPVQRRQFTALVSNTASPTMLRAGTKVNVIPGEAEVEIDGRTLPGQTTEAFLREVQDRLGAGVSLEVTRQADPVTSDRNHPIFRMLSDALVHRDPAAIPVPYVIPGFTDAKAFTRLGTQYFGYAPVRLNVADGLSFGQLYHGNNERIPVEGLRWGTGTLFEAVRRWCAASG